ncbi:MAG: cob(I)yrinic acid a,c-diamide adenosyltransferase [Candidatus Shapirobacteria bacterium]
MSVVTKMGDKGQTGIGGKKVYKDDILIEALGQIDELQAILQIIAVNINVTYVKGIINKMTKDLWAIMGWLGTGKQSINLDQDIREMETQIKKMEEELGEINEFLVFEKQGAVYLNWARTVARRVERRVVSLSQTREVDKNILIWFNRLSDYLFTLGRYAGEKL